MITKYSRSMACSLRLFILGCACISNVRASQVRYYASDNCAFLVRVIGGDGEHTAVATVLKRERFSGEYRFVKSVELENQFAPVRIEITNDGRYLIGLGNVGELATDLSAGVAIYELGTDKSRVIALDSIFDKRDLSGPWNEYNGRFSLAGHIPYQAWFNDVEVDQDASKIYLTGFDRERPSDPPTIIVDCVAMTANVEPAPFFKAMRDNEQAMQEQFLRLWGNDGTLQKNYYLHSVFLKTLEQPKADIIKVNDEIVVRLEPGNGSDPAKLDKLEWDDSTKSMKVSKVIELRNPVAPAMICVSFDGQYVITFDEFDRIGLTENTVVIYGHLSGESRAFGLDDFLSAEQIESLLSVPNIRLWRVSHGIVFEGCDVRNWVKQYRVAWLPKVVVNVSRMEVRVEEPFPSSPSSPLKVDK